jgi:hypothetical protein
MQQSEMPSLIRASVAATLREWHDALAAAVASEEAEVYACAVALISEALASCNSLQALMESYYLPDACVRRLVNDFCLNTEIPLHPRLVMGAACAYRLRERVRGAM